MSELEQKCRDYLKDLNETLKGTEYESLLLTVIEREEFKGKQKEFWNTLIGKSNKIINSSAELDLLKYIFNIEKTECKITIDGKTGYDFLCLNSPTLNYLYICYEDECIAIGRKRINYGDHNMIIIGD